MNILFLSTWYPYPPDNGSKIRVYHLLRALGQRHQVRLVSFAWDTARPDAVDPAALGCTSVEVVRCNPFAANQAGALRTFLSPRPVVSRAIPAMADLVSETLRAHAVDAVIASTEMTADYALQAPPGVARILEEHNSMARWMRERYLEQTSPLQRVRCWASWQKIRRYEARLFGKFDRVTMVSEQDRAASLTDLPGYRGQVAVVPNGVDCQRNRPGLAQPVAHHLVYNGALTYSANYDAMRYFLAEVYPLIRRQQPEAGLTITGSTQGVDLAGLGMQPGVRLSGYVDDVRPLVAGAWAGVVPIRQGGGSRLKILEAMALGTPVVATTKGAEGLDLTPGDEILIADEPAEFAAQVVRLLGDPDLRARLAASARRAVEARYDWRAIGAQFVDLVESTVRERSSP